MKDEKEILKQSLMTTCHDIIERLRAISPLEYARYTEYIAITKHLPSDARVEKIVDLLNEPLNNPDCDTRIPGIIFDAEFEELLKKAKEISRKIAET